MGESKYKITDIKPCKDSGYIFAPYIACGDLKNIDIDSIQKEILILNRSEKLKKILNK